jgi:osmotically-inducible protein OsmY
MNDVVGRLSVWSCAVAVVLSAIACDNTAAGLKRDAEENSKRAAVKASEAAEKASQATAVATEKAGEAAEAAVRTVNVKTALIADKRVTAKDIDVDTDRATKTVTLRGRVPTQEQKAIAEQIAVERSQGYRVRNELVVGN